MIASNELTGSIPTEVGLLTDLTSPDFGKHLFPVLLIHLEQNKSVSHF